MPEVVAADRGGGVHGQRTGQGDAGRFLGLEQLEEGALLQVIGAGGITRGGADPLVAPPDQFLVAQVLFRGVAPELPADPLVQAFGEGLGQTVGQRLQHDGTVVVVPGLEGGGGRIGPQAGGDREGAHPVGRSPVIGGDEVGQGQVGTPGLLLGLLAQGAQDRPDPGAGRVGPDRDVVLGGPVGREEAENPVGGQQPLAGDATEHLLGLRVETAGGLPDQRVVQDGREAAAQFPDGEEGGPVDAFDEFCQRVVPQAEHPRPERFRG